MRSVNTANKIGREIGRDASDVWIPDEVLKQEIRRRIGPQIKLQRSDEDRSFETGQGLLIFTSFVAVVALAATVIVMLPQATVDSMPALTTMRGLIETVPREALILVTAALLLVVIALSFAVAAASRRAKEAHSTAVRALYDAAFQGAITVLAGRRQRTGMAVEVSAARGFLPPSPRPQGVDARGAEEVVAQWMRHLGEADAELTSYTGDGGIDVTGSRSFAQVKHYATSVGVAPVRELAGVAANDPLHRQALFFTSTGYARGAREFADTAGIALFVYDAERGGLEAMNGLAKTLVHRGIR
ncbi:restriction endonuclease [Microbacterium hydrocarbonoxydans]|uniref:restriction endonuclease n=1 Tax=Microbacterium hydrocarbonoxydans TaxID=273678 RepID=UPI00204269FC|nr:restriction endonuclease [Microbacterium hydrocarbonoxydans]MCM3778390.1 restriction endonuclease [Microbacterium hydrocarbonoxydans]